MQPYPTRRNHKQRGNVWEATQELVAEGFTPSTIPTCHEEQTVWPGMKAHACRPSAHKAEVGRLLQAQASLVCITKFQANLGCRVTPYLKTVLKAGGRDEGSVDKYLPTKHEDPRLGLHHLVKDMCSPHLKPLCLAGTNTGGSSELIGQSFGQLMTQKIWNKAIVENTSGCHRYQHACTYTCAHRQAKGNNDSKSFRETHLLPVLAQGHSFWRSFWMKEGLTQVDSRQGTEGTGLLGQGQLLQRTWVQEDSTDQASVAVLSKAPGEEGT